MQFKLTTLAILLGATVTAFAAPLPLEDTIDRIPIPSSAKDAAQGGLVDISKVTLDVQKNGPGPVVGGSDVSA